MVTQELMELFIIILKLANEFINQLYADLNIDVDLIKSNTLQNNFVVVYDPFYDSYDAYDLTHYNPGENLGDFLINSNHSFFMI